MRKIYSILLLTIAILISSCSKEEIINTDNSKLVQVDKLITSYIKKLSSAPNGWIAEIETKLGYYQFHMDFDDKNWVVMYTDNQNYIEYNGVAQKSTYNFRALQRPTLSFDTYSYLSIINDPSDIISGGSGNQGLETDFEFEVEKVEGNVFFLRGRVNRVTAKLRMATSYEKRVVADGQMMNTMTNLINYKIGEFTYFTLADGTDVSVNFYNRNSEIVYRTKQQKTISTNYLTLARMNYDVDFVNHAEINGSELKRFVWKDGKYHAQVGANRFEVKGSPDPIFELHEILGKDLQYTELYSLLDMYSGSSNPFSRLFVDLQTESWKAESVITRFDTDGKMLLDIILNLGGQIVLITYTYKINFNEDGSVFTIGNDFSTEHDLSGLAEELDSIYGSDSLMRYWLGKSFGISWSDNSYDNRKIGEIREVNGNQNAVFYGIPL